MIVLPHPKKTQHHTTLFFLAHTLAYGSDVIVLSILPFYLLINCFYFIFSIEGGRPAPQMLFQVNILTNN